VPEGSIGSVPTPYATRFTEIISNKDDRAGLFDAAKREEILRLIDVGTFELVVEEDAPKHPNIVPSRYVLSIKNKDGVVSLKARFVLGGHRDNDRKSLVHATTTLKQQSVRILLALAALFGFEVTAADVIAAYVQSAENLQRDVFVRPSCMKLGPKELIRIVKPLYGLPDSGDYWGETFRNHHILDLLMKQTTGDFSLFFGVSQAS
jgi:Reverse transcriptase (RNA-dependent DNA polymerase)